MSFSSSKSSSYSSMSGKNVQEYFEERPDHIFEIYDVRYYAINIGKFTDNVIEQVNNDAPWAWLHPGMWLIGAVHLTQKTVARVATTHANEHWYIIIRNITTNDKFILEFAQDGLLKNPLNAAETPNYHLDSMWYSNYRSSRKGSEISGFLYGWARTQYNLISANCQIFVKDFTKFF